jgi:hypothetical protein
MGALSCSPRRAASRSRTSRIAWMDSDVGGLLAAGTRRTRSSGSRLRRRSVRLPAGSIQASGPCKRRAAMRLGVLDHGHKRKQRVALWIKRLVTHTEPDPVARRRLQAGALRQTVARFGVLGDAGTVGLECRRARTAGSVRVPPEHMPFLHRNPRGNGLATARLDADGCETRGLAWGGVRASDRLQLSVRASALRELALCGDCINLAPLGTNRTNDTWRSAGRGLSRMAVTGEWAVLGSNQRPWD